jgi:hypothetical protein
VRAESSRSSWPPAVSWHLTGGQRSGAISMPLTASARTSRSVIASAGAFLDIADQPFPLERDSPALETGVFDDVGERYSDAAGSDVYEVPDVPTINFAKVDVFALVDSDSAEAKTYTTYLGYWSALAGCITENYGNAPLQALTADLTGRKAFRRLSSSQFNGDADTLRSLLLNGWNSELSLYLVDLDDVRLQPANQWHSVYAYYATGRLALAWLLVRDHSAPQRHRALLRGLATQVTNPYLMPMPWSMHCTSVTPPTWSGCPRVPAACSNLATNVDPIDAIGKMLKTTRDRRLEELLAQVRAESGRQRVRPGERQRQDQGLEPTTTFDFAWRSRTRSNYGDPSMFYVGSLGDQAAAMRYLQSIRTWTSATMLMFEAFISQRARAALLDAAMHYISRDRTKICDGLLGQRLRTLGVLQ